MAEKKMGWLKKISLLKKLLAETGPLWPKSTKLAGFSSDGPYSCANCEYLKGMKQGKVFKDEKGHRCIQEVMIADSEVKKDSKGLPIIDDAEHQCCEFVEPYKEKD